LLNEMDSLRDNGEVLFVLTTNRGEALELPGPVLEARSRAPRG
jgi:hypothetical protein